MTSPDVPSGSTWRTPAIIVFFGCLIAAMAFGPRSTQGIFLTPIVTANGWGRDVFGFAVALQNILWGASQPLSGALADRFGNVKVMWVGALLYAAGLLMMSQATTPGIFNISVGLLIGFGLSGCSFPVVLAALGKILPEEWRSFAFGAGTAAGSFGQFLYSPLAVALMDAFGWQAALMIFSASLLLVLPLSLMLAAPALSGTRAAREAPGQSYREALAEAVRHRSYVLLVLGYFTCGFQLQFITVHLPPYLIDRGLTLAIGGWTVATIGLFNIIGSLVSGWLGTFMPRRILLSMIYFGRAMAILAFISFPVTPTSCLVFGAAMGLLWLSTVPPTTSLIAIMFGTRWLAMLAGFAFFSHQVGGFLGVFLGGLAFERTGSYELMWWLAILFGILSALINLPIVEKPVARVATASA